MILLNNPKKLIIHCSDTLDAGDSIGAKEIKKWHIEENGWSDIGYHYVIKRSGNIDFGREETIEGAHTRGNNRDSLGICLVGTKRFSNMQYDALINLIRAIQSRHRIFVDDIYGHYEFNSHKECPGIDMNLLRKFIAIKAVDRINPRN